MHSAGPGLSTRRRLRDALQVTLDLFQTDTANYADYVPPAASFLEFDDVVMSYFNTGISAQVKAVPPLGEALPDVKTELGDINRAQAGPGASEAQSL